MLGVGFSEEPIPNRKIRNFLYYYHSKSLNTYHLNMLTKFVILS